jgi:hypothetical protein
MTQEDKELILKDLSARLPYRVKCSFRYSIKSKILREDNNFELTPTLYDIFTCKREDEDYIKPYLRPMSSMTKEEKEEYDSKRKHICDEYNRYCFDTVESIDWLNAHYFDYRGLIEKGLALEAPEGMYV